MNNDSAQTSESFVFMDGNSMMQPDNSNYPIEQ